RYPLGHGDLASSLHNLGTLLQEQGEHGEARAYLRRALTTYQRLTEVFLATAAEVEALNLLAVLPLTRDDLLTVTRQLADTADDTYGYLWQGKAAVARVLARRQEALLLTGNHEVQALAHRLDQTRQSLAGLLLAAPGPDTTREKRIRELTSQKED